jgi:hypothetical protein
MNRASIAKWWGVTPTTLSGPGVTTYDVQVMSEFRDRVVEAEAELQRKLKYGYAISDDARRHRGPRPGDVIENDKGSGW